MNREIKFRAWNKQKSEMFNIDVLALGECSWSCPDYGKRGVSAQYQPHIPIMQYTGLKDKNGTDIYEGDIGEIKTNSGRIERFEVRWGVHRRDMKSGWTVDIPSFAFIVQDVATFPIANNYLNGHDLDIIEVIGNIYQNPELIKTA